MKKKHQKKRIYTEAEKKILQENEKRRMIEESIKIRYIARQINASVSEKVRESRRGLNDVHIILCNQIEENITYLSDFKLMMDRIWRNVSDLKRRESIRQKGESYGKN